MENKKISDMSDKELVGVVERIEAIGPKSAQAELTRRLIKSMNTLDKSTSRYSKIIIGLTLVLLLVALMQITVSIWGELGSDWIKF